MTISFDYEQDVQTVFSTLTDPDYLVSRNEAMGEVCPHCEVEKAKKQTTISMVREVRRELPGLLAKLFDPVNVMDMTETWRPTGKDWSGDWTLDIQGQPVSITGSFELLATSTGCRYSVTHKAKANIPLLGSQVKKFILGQTAKGAEDELNYLGKYLDQHYG